MTLRLRSTRTAALPMAVALAMLTACGTTTSADAGTTSGSQTVQTSTAADTTTDEATAGSTATVAATAENAPDHDDPADHEWDEADVVDITLDGDSATSESMVAVGIEGSTVTIGAPGTYRLSGTLDDGQVLVTSGADGIVRLILDGVDITSSTSAPLVVTDADEVVVVLADGSQNHLSDAATYVYPDAETDEPNAALFSTADLTITGTGALTVEGNANDGIASKDGLVIASGTITVDAVDDGIRGKDYLVIDDGDITVTAGGDGLKSDNEEDATMGYVSVAAGTLAITAGVDGIDAVTDAIITGGDLTLATGDDGVHADATLTVAGGSVAVTESYEGLESAVITIDGGDIDITASDDGLNVAGGVDGSGQEGMGADGGPGGGDQFAASAGLELTISGGTVVIDADGDGLDSNGSVAMTGGTVVVSGPTGNGNGAIDVNGEFLISGGVLLAAGSAGMAETPDASSAQATLAIGFGASEPAGTVVHIVSSAGDELAAFESSKAFETLVLSTPDVVSGQTYEVLLGGTVTGSTVGGLSLDSDPTGATSLGTLTAG
ncbi:carbohydrate-binding domain-containing protein [Cellulomonas sp. KRMCY2]|uniref:carbohydrate-binding domain-containing protein n=1 Tax=Cellulomonas sp. KRMCY2 TaxID=1304865 RepID=UPI0004AF951D|nr:carbohydrate-binding domain-containing protein [Cellulomonas sp. KRMCY2]